VNTWKAILAALVIFGAGLVTGTVLYRVSDSAKPVPGPGTTHPSGARPPQTLPLEHLRKMELMMHVQKELNLTPEQHERIEKVISEGQEHIRDLWDQVAPDIHDELQQVREKVYAELTQEQKKHFDELMKQPRPHKSAPANAASTNAVPTNSAPKTVTQ
jgi:Spy/CpxP family protein refolding chaperone